MPSCGKWREARSTRRRAREPPRGLSRYVEIWLECSRIFGARHLDCEGADDLQEIRATPFFFEGEPGLVLRMPVTTACGRFVNASRRSTCAFGSPLTREARFRPAKPMSALTSSCDAGVSRDCGETPKLTL